MLSPYVVGQTTPSWALTWTDDSGTAFDLTGATVTLAFYTAPGSAAVAGMGAGTVTVTSAAAGKFTYGVTATDTAVAGTWYAVFKADYGGGKVLYSDPVKFIVNSPG